MLDPTELFPEVPNLYEFPSIHNDMIYDEHRVEAYRRAIERSVKVGDIVADVGTGTGILAFLCLRAGAARVHAIDRSPVINWARRLAEANGLGDRIIFHQCDSRDAKIDEKADVIVSELIGHIAFEEGMVESISDAMARFLKPGGLLIPRSVTLYAAPVYEREVYRSCIDGWKPAYGIDYSVMREQALQTSYVTDIDERDLFAKHQAVFSVDFTRDVHLEVHAERTFDIYREGHINGMAFWFDSALSDVVHLSSGPWSKTHWKQCFTPLDYPRKVEAGGRLDVAFTMMLCNRPGDKFAFRVELSRGDSNAS
jgi:2-polyprenyl-3-methyl-5-hydroxy-6-metoxy-1,4-benzoquinol methylase